MNNNVNVIMPIISISSSPVTCQPRKLRAVWTMKTEQDFQAYHAIQKIDKFKEINKILHGIFYGK